MVIPGSVTRILFFTGKGGVGKTSVASAMAVGVADRGKRVLLVSTDPASNLDEVFGVELGMRPTPIPDVPGLSAMNIDPEASARAYRERMVGPYRGILPDASVRSMEEQFSGACTVEIAAFDEFSRLLGDASATAEFDHVIFDTAPTGHTLRLLQLPAAWTVFLEQQRRVGTPAWVRSRGSPPSGHSTSPPSRHSPTRKRQPSCSSRGPMRRPCKRRIARVASLPISVSETSG